MADKIAAENAERQKKEEEMAQRLKEAQEVQYQEATYIERADPEVGWRRCDIAVDRSGGVHSLLLCTSSTLESPTCH